MWYGNSVGNTIEEHSSIVCLMPHVGRGHNAPLIQLLISALYVLFACLLGFPTYFLFL